MSKEKKTLLSVAKAAKIISIIAFISCLIYAANILIISVFADFIGNNVSVDFADSFGSFFNILTEPTTDITFGELLLVNSYKIVRYILKMLIIFFVFRISEKMCEQKEIFYYKSYKDFICLAVFGLSADYFPELICTIVKDYVENSDKPFVLTDCNSEGYLFFGLAMFFLIFLFRYGEKLRETEPFNLNLSNPVMNINDYQPPIRQEEFAPYSDVPHSDYSSNYESQYEKEDVYTDNEDEN